MTIANPSDGFNSLGVALDYVKRHHRRFLLPLPPGMKSPPCVSFADASNDPDVIKGWHKRWPGCNWAVLHRVSHVQIADVDTNPLRNKVGQDTFELLDILYGFPDTEITTTPSGGRHHIFESEREHIFALGEAGLGKDIDCPHYTLIPGCRLKDGGVYVSNGAPAVDCPDWIYDVLRRAKVRIADAGEAVVDLDQPEMVTWAIDHLQNDAEPAVEGNNGDHQTFKVAASLRDNGISQVLAVDLMVEHYNERCEPPWEIEDLERKVANAYEYANLHKAGGKTAEADFADDDAHELAASIKPMGKASDDDGLDADLLPVKEKYPEPLAISALLQGDYPRTSYTVDDLVMERIVNMFYGDGGTGKTTVSVQMGVAVSAGVPIFGRTTIQAPVLLVLAEDSEGEVKPRIEGAIRDLGLTEVADTLPLRTWCLQGPDISIARINEEGKTTLLPFYHELKRRLAETPGMFVVLDSLVDIAQMQEAGRMAPNTFFKKVLTRLANQYGATFLVLGHPSKAAMTDGTGYSGSTAYRNAVRNMIEIKKIKGSSFRSLARLKNNYAADNERLVLGWADGIFVSPQNTVIADAEQGRYRAVLAVVLDLIGKGINVARNNQADGHTPKDVAKIINDAGIVTVTHQDVAGFMKQAEAIGDLTYVNGSRTTKAHYEVADNSGDFEAGGSDDADPVGDFAEAAE